MRMQRRQFVQLDSREAGNVAISHEAASSIRRDKAWSASLNGPASDLHVARRAAAAGPNVVQAFISVELFDRHRTKRAGCTRYLECGLLILKRNPCEMLGLEGSSQGIGLGTSQTGRLGVGSPRVGCKCCLREGDSPRNSTNRRLDATGSH
jgi:hypothetical protein